MHCVPHMLGGTFVRALWPPQHCSLHKAGENRGLQHHNTEWAYIWIHLFPIFKGCYTCNHVNRNTPYPGPVNFKGKAMGMKGVVRKYGRVPFNNGLIIQTRKIVPTNAIWLATALSWTMTYYRVHASSHKAVSLFYCQVTLIRADTQWQTAMPDNAWTAAVDRLYRMQCLVSFSIYSPELRSLIAAGSHWQTAKWFVKSYTHFNQSGSHWLLFHYHFYSIL